MTVALHGLGVSRGIAVGRAVIFARDDLKVAEYRLADDDIAQELQRYLGALQHVQDHLMALRQRMAANAPADFVSFIETHLLMLDDPVFVHGPLQTIREMGCNAEWALKLQRDALIDVFESMDDSYLRARRDDVDYVVTQILRALLNVPARISEAAPGSLDGTVIVAEDLSPADVVVMHEQGIAAIVAESGGSTSHTAILARNLGIPAVFGLRNVQRFLTPNEILIVDGRHGLVVVAPDRSLLAFYEQRRVDERAHIFARSALRDSPSVTRDGCTIALMANVDFLDDVRLSKAVGAMGIGLFRTELLYLGRNQIPEEEEQYTVYRQVLASMDGAPVTIRTLDIGADKSVPWYDGAISSAVNPALSLRGIRWCLREPEIFRTQLRALLRASVAGQMRIMIPMLTCSDEVVQTLELIAEVKAQLQAECIPFDGNIAIGGMIEIPAAAIIAETFARKLDFLSIGTNDLIQYTLAADRTDDSVSSLYDPLHPAVLRLIKMTLDAGNAAGIPVAMCGEMAGDIRYTRLLLGLGLREFSMHPALLLEIKESVSTNSVGELCRQVVPMVNSGDRTEIARFVAEIAPGLENIL